MDKCRTVLDYDLDYGDAITITLATKSPQTDSSDITAVTRNQTSGKTTANVLSIYQYLGLDTPVYVGCGQPMTRDKQVITDDIHEETGFDEPVFASLQKKAEDKHAVLYITDTLMASDGDITLVPTDPLTNTAMAIRLEPRILPKTRETVLMGDCYRLGNVMPAAKFDILTDTDATHVVFTRNRPITIMGLDVARKVLYYPFVIERMEKIGTPPAMLLVDLIRSFSRSQKAVFGREGRPFHDPLTTAYPIDPAIFITRAMFTEIDIRSVQSYSRTNCDFFGYFKREPNSSMVVEMDVRKSQDIIEQGVCNYD